MVDNRIHSIEDTELIQNSELRIQNSELRVKDSGLRIKSEGFSVQNKMTGGVILNSEFK